MEIEKLDWDTGFFGFNVARIKNDSLWQDTNLKLENIFKQNVELGVFTSSKPGFEKFDNKYYNITNVYNRVPIIKEVKLITPVHQNISSYSEKFPCKDLIELAKLAGKEGRFGKDLRISEETYNEIFEQWITNSVNRSVADDVLVYEIDDRVVGFGSIKIEGENGYAPLFAVNRAFEGKGVSFALMRAIENNLIEKGCKYLVSGTQENNKKALAAFKRFGFELQSIQYVFHLWKRN